MPRRHSVPGVADSALLLIRMASTPLSFLSNMRPNCWRARLAASAGRSASRSRPRNAGSRVRPGSMMRTTCFEILVAGQHVAQFIAAFDTPSCAAASPALPSINSTPDPSLAMLRANPASSDACDAAPPKATITSGRSRTNSGAQTGGLVLIKHEQHPAWRGRSGPRLQAMPTVRRCRHQKSGLAFQRAARGCTR